MIVFERKLRLVHPMRPLLTKAQLAHFATPLTWEQILGLDPEMTAAQWRDGVIDADPHGFFGLLTWTQGTRSLEKRTTEDVDRTAGTWCLTDRGRVHVFGRRRAA